MQDYAGHKDPRIHLKMLRKPQQWDVSLMPINAMDALYRSFLEEVVPVCHELGVAPIGMKGLGGGYPQGMLVQNGINTRNIKIRRAAADVVAMR